MTMHSARFDLPSLCAIVCLLLAACATPLATDSISELPFDQAIVAATDGLVSQTERLPAFLAKVKDKLVKRSLMVDPMIDAASAQQTAATRRLEEQVAGRLRSTYTHFEVLPFQPANLSKVDYVLTGTMTRRPSATGVRGGAFQISLALVEMKSGYVVAQASSRARAEGIDINPTPYYGDSPILVKDKVVEGYVRTSQTSPGNSAESAYFERIGTATVLNDATLAYNSGRYEEAYDLYGRAHATPSGKQLRALIGMYLASWKLGRTAEAEQAFAQVVAMGLANNNLGVKFLFNPNSTDFWSDPKISGPYGLWLRQIARQAVDGRVCMEVIGHTSRTGSEHYNDRLSLQRATYIKQRLQSEATDLGGKLRASGKGFRENIVGTGADDASDSLDRRVEFKIIGCQTA